MHDELSTIARALSAAAQSIDATATIEETLDAIVREARRSVPGFDHIGVSISHRDGTIETRAATDQLVWDLDRLQYEVGEGPCLDSIHTAPVLVVEHAATEKRWPAFMPRAVERGLRSQLAVRLFRDHETLGGLNLYSTSSDTVDPDAVAIAELFATHAAIALGRVRHEHDLNQALASRKVIGQAIGIIMERYGINEDRAFHFLVRASSTSNAKLRMIAEEVVATTDQRYTVAPYTGDDPAPAAV